MTTLQAKLDAYKEVFETTRATPEALKIMHGATKALKDSDILDHAIKLGDQLPNFSLKNQDGEVVTLADKLANGPLVISFFRGVWCPYCNIELKWLGDAAEDIRAAGGELVVISPQTPKYAQKSHRDNELTCDVLVDEGNAYARQLGTVFRLPDDLEKLYAGFGVDLPMYNGDDSWSLPMPLRAVIDQQGTIRYLDINADYTQRPEVSDTLDVLRSLTSSAKPAAKEDSEVHWPVNVSINEGKLDDFKAVMKDMIASTKNEAGTLAYEWGFNADETECYIYERYTDSDAVLTHFGNFGPFVDRFRAACERNEIVVLGHPKGKALEVLNGLEPIYAKTAAGFSRLTAA